MKDTSKKEKEKGGLGGWLLIVGWLFFILLVLIFYFYFRDDLKEMKNRTKTSTEMTDEEFRTNYSYETNANIEINALINDYLMALTACDQQTLQSLVTDPSVFDDMTVFYEKAQYMITKYSNINCYTVDGYTEDTTIVYVTSNITIKDVSSSPMDITRFYVIKTEDGYKINNGVLSVEANSYIEEVTSSPDIQELYENVKKNIDQCVAEDPEFAAFYEKVFATENVSAE